jgi:hypothetical protein
MASKRWRGQLCGGGETCGGLVSTSELITMDGDVLHDGSRKGIGGRRREWGCLEMKGKNCKSRFPKISSARSASHDSLTT